jgi:hypothetical protein
MANMGVENGQLLIKMHKPVSGSKIKQGVVTGSGLVSLTQRLFPRTVLYIDFNPASPAKSLSITDIPPDPNLIPHD